MSKRKIIDIINCTLISLQEEYINRKAEAGLHIQEVDPGEPWLSPSAVLAEREEDSAGDGQVIAKLCFDVVQGEFTRFYHVYTKHTPSGCATPFLCHSSREFTSRYSDTRQGLRGGPVLSRPCLL